MRCSLRWPRRCGGRPARPTARRGWPNLRGGEPGRSGRETGRRWPAPPRPRRARSRRWGRSLRLSPKDPACRRDGLTYTALDMSRGEAVALKALTAPRAYPALHKVGVPSLLASFSRPLLKYDGTVVAIVGPASTEPVGAPA